MMTPPWEEILMTTRPTPKSVIRMHGAWRNETEPRGSYGAGEWVPTGGVASNIISLKVPCLPCRAPRGPCDKGRNV